MAFRTFNPSFGGEVKSEQDSEMELTDQISKLGFNPSPAVPLPKVDPTFANEAPNFLRNHIVIAVLTKLASQIPDERTFSLIRQKYEKTLLAAAQQFLSRCDQSKIIDQLIDGLVKAFRTPNIEQAIKDAVKDCLMPWEAGILIDLVLNKLMPDGMLSKSKDEKETIAIFKNDLVEVLKQFDSSDVPKIHAHIIELLERAKLPACASWTSLKTPEGSHPDTIRWVEAGDRLQVILELTKILAGFIKQLPPPASRASTNMHALFNSWKPESTSYYSYTPRLTVQPEDFKKGNIAKQLLAKVDAFCEKTGAGAVNLTYSEDLDHNREFVTAAFADKRIKHRHINTTKKSISESKVSIAPISSDMPKMRMR